MFFLFLLYALFGAEKETLKVDTEKSLKLTEKFTIIDDFYSSILTTVSDNGDLYVFDKGNLSVSVYNEKKEKLSSYEKSGNGPGELNSRIFHFEVFNEHLVFQQWNKLMIFTRDWQLVSEIKGIFTRGLLTFDTGLLAVNYVPDSKSKNTTEWYEIKTGNLFKETKNKNYIEKPQTAYTEETYTKTLLEPVGYILFNNQFANFNRGTYKINILNLNSGEVDSFSRSFESIKEVGEGRWKKYVKDNNVTDKERLKYYAMLDNTRKKVLNGYKNDIRRILGYTQEHLLVSTQVEDTKTLAIDIISLKDKSYNSFQYSFNSEIETAHIDKGYLLVNLKDDENGPYCKVFNIETQ